MTANQMKLNEVTKVEVDVVAMMNGYLEMAELSLQEANSMDYNATEVELFKY